MVAAMLAIGVAWPAVAANWAVVPDRSSLTFAADWDGRAVEGRLPRFDARIRFDPERLAEASIAVDIDLSAATTSDRTVNSSLPQADWFDVRRAATARFVASEVRATGPGRYVASGTLTLRGRTVPVSLPFTLAIRGNVATVQGETRLDRRAFGIGTQSDPQGQWVAFAVPVRLRLVATRQGG
jgi:polyisoprenoid-binding protein YceI